MFIISLHEKWEITVLLFHEKFVNELDTSTVYMLYLSSIITVTLPHSEIVWEVYTASWNFIIIYLTRVYAIGVWQNLALICIMPVSCIIPVSRLNYLILLPSVFILLNCRLNLSLRRHLSFIKAKYLKFSSPYKAKKVKSQALP